MKIEIEDLRIGDEILFPINSKLVWAKVLREPRRLFNKDGTQKISKWNKKLRWEL